ncbi:MAG TPA: hypothetical protein VFC44_27400 [Candidatus Saccharimonadales bacterium]|nr:hypothetical protein [Candidatus Saccharimonadales bacterium]
MLALFFVGGGTAHFLNSSFYLTIVPSFLPHPLALVYISGVFEILGGLGVLVPACRRWAGYGLIALLVAVFPANIKMFHDHLGHGLTWITAGLFLRIPLQIVFIVVVERLTRPGLDQGTKGPA